MRPQATSACGLKLLVSTAGVYWRPAEEELTWQLYHELDMLQERLLERARAKKKEMANMRNVERVWEFFQHPARFFVELLVRAVMPRTMSCLEHVQLRQAVDKLDVFWLLLRRYIYMCVCGDMCITLNPKP
jgi:hypothetical protein